MSTCLSHLGSIRNPNLLAGADDENDVLDFTRLLEEQHGPAMSPGDNLDAFLEWVQGGNGAEADKSSADDE